ncbi:MAG: hypothetical protein AAF809_11720, partial [Bacteroidota bacterium]
MNKVAFLAVAATALFVSTLTANSYFTGAEITEDARLTEQEVIAQRVANSGLELAISQVRRDFDGWRSTLASAGGAASTFNAAAAGTAAGPVVVASTGTVDTTSFDVYRLLARLASLPAAVTLDADTAAVTFSGTGWVISGRDTPSFSEKARTEGYGLAGTRVPAVWAQTSATEAALRSALTNTTRPLVRGVSDDTDIVQSLSGSVSTLVAEAKGAITNDYAQPQTFANASFGSVGNPVIVRVQGDASFSGTSTGYGMLIVEGGLQVRGTFEWHGLIFAEGTGDMVVDLGGRATVYGAVYVDHTDTHAPVCVSETARQQAATAAVAPFASFPSQAGTGTRTNTIAWPGFPSVEVRAELSKSGGSYSGAEVKGATLQGAAQAAVYSGVSTGLSDINNPDYTGPRDLQLLSFSPGEADGWAEVNLRLTLDAAMTEPFYLHLLDLDHMPLTIEAYDASGSRVSTASWASAEATDLLLQGGQAENISYRWNGATGDFRPSRYVDAEIIAGQLLVSNFNEVRQIRIRMRNTQSGLVDGVYLGLSTEPLTDSSISICPPGGSAPGGGTTPPGHPGTHTGSHPVHVGDTQTPGYAGWASDDHTGNLLYYTIDINQATKFNEGQLLGIQETQRFDVVDVEAMTFADDGSLYFINDGDPYSGTQRNGLYRIDPSQLDGNPNTPVQTQRIGGREYSGASNDDDVMGLIFQDDVLHGITLASGRILRLSTTTGAITEVGTFDDQGRTLGGLTRGSDGKVYFLGNQGNHDVELWRFDNFPQGNPTKVSTLTGIRYSEAISAHPDGFLYVLEGGSTGGTKVARVNPSDGSFTTQMLSHEDVQAFAFYFAGESQAIGTHIVAPLTALPRMDGPGTYNHTVGWPGHPSIQVQGSITASDSSDPNVFMFGSTLAAEVDYSVSTDYAHVHAAEINNPAYTGPRNLPVFRFNAGNTVGNTATVRFTFDEALTQPYYLHVIDLDRAPVTITAFDANGNRVPTTSWRAPEAVDLWLDNGVEDAYTYTWNPSAGTLTPDQTDDKEIYSVQLALGNYADVRSINIEFVNQLGVHDNIRLGFSAEPFYEEQRTALQYTMRDQAQVYYSAEALGQLAALLPSVKQASWITEYDQFGMDLRAIFDDGQGQSDAANQPRREDANRVLVCIDGR